jgi:altronate dehydratase small subunit
MTKLKAVIISPKDNVATAVANLPKGEEVELEVGQKIFTVKLKAPISLGHKFSLSQIDNGSPIIKYGEVIGTATKSIAPGEHVHIHNVASTRGRGDLLKEEV